MSTSSENTRDIAKVRKAILSKWFEDLKVDDKWKDWVNNKGMLKVSAARKELYRIETDGGKGSWDDSYFKNKHWSNQPRVDFEFWVEGELMMCSGQNKFASIDKRELGLEPWLDNVELPDAVQDLIIELARDKKRFKEQWAQAERRVKKAQEKALALEVRMRSTSEEFYGAIEEHYMESIRTIKFGAGRDLDLSQRGLFDSEDA